MKYSWRRSHVAFQALRIQSRRIRKQRPSGTSDGNREVDRGVLCFAFRHLLLSTKTICDGRAHCSGWRRYARIQAKQLDGNRLSLTTMYADLEVRLCVKQKNWKVSLRKACTVQFVEHFVNGGPKISNRYWKKLHRRRGRSPTSNE